MNTRRQFIGASIAGSILGTSNAFAQPSGRPTRFVVGFTPGGGTDTIARMAAESARKAFPNGLIVENKPGASSRIAVDYVKASAPDGLTMLVTPDFSLTVYPHSFPKLSYDPIKDLTPVATISLGGLALCAGPAVPDSVKNPSDYLDWCKANPKLAIFGSPGAGSSFHFAGIMLGRARGIDLMHVGYKGGAPALQDVMGGQIPTNICAIGEAIPFLQSGKLRILGTFGAQRDEFAPEALTMVESGFKEVVAEAWIGAFMPAKTPPEIVAKAAKALNEVTEGRALTERFAKYGMKPLTRTPIQLAALLRSDIERWGPTVRASGFTADE